MTDHTQLRKLAEAAIGSQGSAAWYDHYMAYDEAVENPQTVIELLDEIDRLKEMFRVNMLRAFPEKSHNEIAAEIEKAVK